jgi:hypothetical protein
MVGAEEVCYLEGQHFHAEVCSTSKCYEQVDLSEGNGLKSRYDCMEWSTEQPYDCS